MNYFCYHDIPTTLSLVPINIYHRSQQNTNWHIYVKQIKKNYKNNLVTKTANQKKNQNHATYFRGVFFNKI